MHFANLSIMVSAALLMLPPPSRAQSAEDDPSLGLILGPVPASMAAMAGTSANEGQIVMAVKPGSRADAQGLRRGDILLSVCRLPCSGAPRPLSGPDQLSALVREAGSRGLFRLDTRRGRETRSMTIVYSTASRPIAKPALPPVPRIMNAMPLGRELQVTRAMVSQDRGLFRQYWFDARFSGRRGERFQLSWRGTLPLFFDQIRTDAYDIRWGAGSKLTDPVATVTLTLTSDGEQTISLGQTGAVFPHAQGILPSYDGAIPRDFQPYTVTLRKLS